jgi:hypothetical protein
MAAGTAEVVGALEPVGRSAAMDLFRGRVIRLEEGAMAELADLEFIALEFAGARRVEFIPSSALEFLGGAAIAEFIEATVDVDESPIPKNPLIASIYFL